MELIESPEFNNLLDLIYLYINKYKLSNNLYLLWKLKMYIHIPDELLTTVYILDKFIYDYYNVFIKISNYMNIVLGRKKQYLTTLIKLKDSNTGYEDKKYLLQLTFFDIYHEVNNSLNTKDYYIAYGIKNKIFNDISYNLFICSNLSLSDNEIVFEFKQKQFKLYTSIKKWCSKLNIKQYLKPRDLYISHNNIYENPIIYNCGELLLNDTTNVKCEYFDQLSSEIRWYIQQLKLSYAQLISVSQIHTILCNKFYRFKLSENLSLSNLLKLSTLNDIEYIAKVIYSIFDNPVSCIVLRNNLIILYKMSLTNNCYNINFIFKYNMVEYIDLLYKYINLECTIDDIINKLTILQINCNKHKLVYKLTQVANLYNNIPFMIFKYILQCKQTRLDKNINNYIYIQLCNYFNYEINIIDPINNFMGNMLSNIYEYIFDINDDEISIKIPSSNLFLYDIYLKNWKNKMVN